MSAPSHEVPSITRSRALTGFWIVAGCFTASTALGTFPTPLYRLYQHHGGFGEFVSTVVFAFYAIGILLALIFAGHLSDLYGRRTMLLIATGTSVLSAVTFCTSTSLAALLLGRLVCGVGTGLMASTATAYLSDLYERARPGRGTRGASIASTACNLGGLGAGAAISGIAAATLPAPLFTPYLIALALLAVALAAGFLLPETMKPPESRPHYSIQPARIPAGHRRVFWSAAVTTALSFSITGLFASQAPNLITAAMGGGEREELSGTLALVVFIAAALAQILLARGPARRQVVVALGLLVPSFAIAVIGAASHTLVLLLAGAALSGAAAGLCLTGAVAAALEAAAPEHRSGTLKATFLVAYSGLVLPVMGFGSTVQWLGFGAALWIYLGVVAVTAVGILSVLAGERSTA